MDTKISENSVLDIDISIAYAQLAVHTLQNSGTELTDKAIKDEIKMFYQKFGNKEVKRLVQIFATNKKKKK
jgi:hypothetical protein